MKREYFGTALSGAIKGSEMSAKLPYRMDYSLLPVGTDHCILILCQ